MIRNNYLIFLSLILMPFLSLGQECDIIYVSPNGSGSGTKAAPTSIQNALNLVGPGIDQIRMAQGTYPISDTLFLVSGVTIDGSYDPSTWVKSNNIPTVIHRDATAPTSVSIFALAGINISDFHIHDISVVVDDALEPSSSTCGIYLNGCSDYSINRVRVTAGDGGDGIQGNPGASGMDGAMGGGAELGTNCGNGPNAGGAGGNSWSGGLAAGGDGGNGGPEGEDFDLFSQADGENGFNGLAGVGDFPGIGGVGGQGFYYILGDACTAIIGDCGTVGPASMGTNGADATIDGAPGADGTDGVSMHDGTFFVPGHGTYGQNGENGSGGGGGGGGGSAGAGYVPWASTGTGPGGGGGGEGGQGGYGATSGGGGGGSFGMYITNNGTGGVLNDCVLQTGAPGLGGTGGFPGGYGGLGGSGGLGGEQPDGVGPCSNGGNGGDGSNGGQGGAGGDGAPGESIALYQQPTGIQVSQTNLAANVEPDVLLESTGCTYSDIYFSTNANGIIEWFYEGTTVPQNTVGQSTTVQYTTYGAQDLTMVSNGVPYFHAGFVNIFTDGSPYLPTIQGDDTICPGDIVNFSSTWPISFNVLGYRWNFGDPNSGTANTSTQATPSHQYNEVGTYMVTLQTQSPCCNWSKPDTFYVEVFPVVGPDVFITATTTEICEGESITFGAVP
ncbi:MAG: PKD domain-containing protein, partial [Flavobacteriales bacterium]|nr:PKD domain-containing protein [Flavobacteriales bacterium]